MKLILASWRQDLFMKSVLNDVCVEVVRGNGAEQYGNGDFVELVFMDNVSPWITSHP